MVDVEKILQNIAKKSGTEMGKLREEYNTVLQKVPPGDKREEKALKELNKVFSVGRSPAVSYEGIILGIGQLGDYAKTRIAKAMEAYQNDPQSAISQGMVKLEGDEVIVLDNRAEFSPGKPNNNFGKPLGHGYNRTCVALVKEDGVYQLATVELRGKHATEQLPPLNTLLKFRANGGIEDGLRTSESATKWETLEIVEQAKLTELLNEKGGDHIVSLGDCMDYHRSLPEGTQEYYNRFVITSGQVAFTKEPKEGSDTAFMVLDDMTVDESVSCFVPAELPLPEDQADITVIAQTGIGKKWDRENKVKTDEEVLQMNVLGIISS